MTPSNDDPTPEGRPIGRTTDREHDVVVVGGGPSGAATAYWLAEAGWDVLVLEKKHFPRDKTCGDGLTPRSVRQLEDMGLADDLASHHRFEGLRAVAFGREMEMNWPSTPDFGGYGYVITRAELDRMVAGRAEKVGAAVWQGAEAVAPLDPAGSGRCGGVLVKDRDAGTETEVRARYVVVADGANSRIGRALGTSRDKSLPLGMAIRGYYTSPRHDEPWIESHLDIRDKAGNVVPGYGWIFPLGDGRVNVGVGLLSTFDRWKEINTSHLMDAFVSWAPASWGISPETACGPATGGRLPMGMSVGPHHGADWLAVGDAGGSINPFNGEGIAYAYETGRLAAAVLGEALAGGGPAALAHYDRLLDDTYGVYYKVASAFVGLIGKPKLMRALVGTGMYSKPGMTWVLRVMSNLMRPDELGPAEAAYKLAARLLELRSSVGQ
ncbi:MAG TPA: geranylgeranyl reductase family protein [Acidimicrobiales bacterium]|nr:geranylgeranyl reductase family protein [Acidimicrobiales bacterium]